MNRLSLERPFRAGPLGWRSIRPSVRRGALYLLGALAATAVNILVQEIARRLGPAEAILVPMLAGTAAGFAAKYLFDKYLVFADPYRDGASELRKVGLYGLLSVGTTGVFWGTELAFWWVWQTPQARYAGAVLGLAIGYAVKYRLDRALVFRDRAS